MLACSCLNILIETGNDFQKVTPEILCLKEEEKNDTFFKQDVMKVGKLISINKAHSDLVQKRKVGSWIVTRCSNCECHTHAVHREKGASCVLIYSRLLNAEAIESLRASDIFSTIFNIVVNPNDIGEDEKLLDTYLTTEVETMIRNIREVATEYLRKEMIAVEQRIKKYTEEQYEALNNLRDRAFKEQESLVRVIRSTVDQTKPESTKKIMATTKPHRQQPVTLTDRLSGGLTSSMSSSSVRNKSMSKKQKNSPSFEGKSLDAEGLFEFEASDDVNTTSESEMDDSDREVEECNQEEGVSIPRQRATGAMIAKSLPVNIPAFMSQARSQSTEDLDDSEVLGSNVDIAASMKALAKSVHGDTIFGDLPRPRFSTQL